MPVFSGYGQEHLNHDTHISLWGLMAVPSVASLWGHPRMLSECNQGVPGWAWRPWCFSPSHFLCPVYSLGWEEGEKENVDKSSETPPPKNEPWMWTDYNSGMFQNTETMARLEAVLLVVWAMVTVSPEKTQKKEELVCTKWTKPSRARIIPSA